MPSCYFEGICFCLEQKPLKVGTKSNLYMCIYINHHKFITTFKVFHKWHSYAPEFAFSESKPQTIQ